MDMHTQKEIKVIVCRVGRAPTIEVIERGLTAMQRIVGGTVSCMPLGGSPFDHGIDLWFDDEFLLKGYKPNRLVVTPDGASCIHGDFFIAAHDGEGDTIGLTDAEAARWQRLVARWPVAARPKFVDFERVLGEDDRATLAQIKESRNILRAAGIDPEDRAAVRDAYEEALFDACS